MVIEFNVPPQTPLEDLRAELTSPANQPPQVFNEDSLMVNTDGVNDAGEDEDLVQIDNPVWILSSEDHPPDP